MASAQGQSFRQAYAESLAALAKTHPAVPDVEIEFKDLSYVLHLKAKTISREIATVPGAFAKLATLPMRLAEAAGRVWTGKPDPSMQDFVVLDRCSGVLKPGRTTLLLSPPGHGKTSFLRALAGRLAPSAVKGSVTYSGLTGAQVAEKGMQLRQLVQYVDQLDVHMPLMTVRETFAFAAANANVGPEFMGDNAALLANATERVENIIKLLGLSNCANTIVGNDLFRGVSGGEKKRVTIGEAMVTNARAFLMDEISTGLDSSVTFDIVSSIKAWAQIMRGTVVIALLQPTPEVYNLFDDVILMREGGVLYHGPRVELPGYLASLGFFPPMPALSAATATAPVAPDAAAAASANKVDVADWLVELITNPSGTHAKDKERKREEARKATTGSRLGMSHGSLDNLAAEDSAEAAALRAELENTPAPPVDTPSLMKAFAASKLAADMVASSSSTPLELKSEFAQAQYARATPRSPWYHFTQLMWRQVALTSRNSIFVTSRLVMCIIMALVLGSTFWQLDFQAGPQKYGLFLFAALHVAFANMSEVSIAVEDKYVVYKHVFSGMYPSVAYVFSAAAVHLPIAFVETFIFSAIMYFMCGLVNEAGRFLFFTLALFMVNIGMAAFLRFFAYISPDMETAQVAPSPVISIQMLFAGYLITRTKMSWLIFLHYISIFGYALRSMAQNEFLADKYSGFNAGSSVSVGESFLQFFDFQTEQQWKWGGIAFMAFFFVVCNVLSGWAMGYVRIERNIGTSRSQEGDASAEAELDMRLSSPVASKADINGVTSPITPSPQVSPADVSSRVASAVHAASALPFEPMTITFSTISYTVPVVELDPSDPTGKRRIARQKTLLQNVSGYAKPGTLTALMGASGAGKTTLLDVIGGRKNTGVMKGSITLNGFPKEHRAFSRLTAYVEQQDIHNAFSTVREALHFSASLRLPSNVTAAQRLAFVEETLDVLELRSIADRKIGESGAADGLSPGQRKRLTIGVEVVCNAPIVFLDEPTTALDSRNAQVVMRVIRNLASRGRTVITTIHQPSAELFYMMDNLLLLQRGGWQVYFGPLGHHKADQLRHYLEAIPGTPACPRRMNPASWMLDVLAGTDSSGDSAEKDVEVTEVVEDAAAGASNGGSTTVSPSAVVPVDASGVALDGTRTVALSRQVSMKGKGTRLVPSDTHPGAVDYQAILQSTPEWKDVMTEIAHMSTPAPGSKPFTFDSVFAQSVFTQFTTLLTRVFTSNYRNVDYNFVRITTLIGLMVLFGTVYYKLDGNDVGGIQSLVSLMFMTTAFVGILNMNVAVPVLLKERAVYYRERASFLYGPEVYAFCNFLSELPWLALIVMTCVPVVYFMSGFRPTGEAFFFYVFTVFILALVFVSAGQLAAAVMPNIAIAQAVLGALIPLFFLFGGLFLRTPDIPVGWRWMNTIDPLKYATASLLTPQFYCDKPAAECVKISIPGVAGVIDRYDYISSSFGVSYEERWVNLGYLVCFVAAFQVLSFIATRYVNHLKR